MKHTVIGTAGHIDHGKTMLLKALTGTDADRLPEEKERGMTIDLGFVFLGKNVTIIDVPGHEKFIKNMLAGVSTIDLVILVIAADDGIMPQTKEHFEILQLLDVRYGVVALTKTDLVDADWLDLVKDDIAAFVKGTFLENAPVMCVSSTTGEGIPEFRALLDTMIENTQAKSDKGVFRLWIDRVFTLKGIGTVIAGTVLSGAVKPGDKLTLLPQDRGVRVRKLQVHNEDVQQSATGERVAINLIGVDAAEIERGNMLAKPGYFEPTYMVNAKLYLLKDAGKPLSTRTRVRFHIGTKEILARVVMLEKKALEPGQSAIVQFRLEEKAPADPGDRYIIRSYSPAYTIGGGSIVETHPKKLKYLPDEEVGKLDRLEQADSEQLLLHYLANHPLEMKTVEKLAAALSLKTDKMTEIVDKLIQEGTATVVSEHPAVSIVLSEHIEKGRSRIADFLKQHHKQHPYLWGMKKSELKMRVFGKIENAVCDAIVNPMVERGELVYRHETLHRADHRVTFTESQEKLRARIEELYRSAQFVTPSAEELEQLIPDVKKRELRNVVTGLIEMGTLIEIKTAEERAALFHIDNMNEAEKILVGMLKEKGKIRLYEFRERINSTRKYTTPILIYFDRRGLTEFDGEYRRLKDA